MNNFIKKTLHCILISASLCFFCAGSYAEGPTATEYGVVLNLSGKQRMLTQKMSKEVLLIALGIEKKSNIDNLRKTSTLFDKTLNGLRDGDKDLNLPPTISRRIIRQLDKIKKLWDPFNSQLKKITISGEVSLKQVTDVAIKNLPLLKQMNRCVKLYEKDASKAGLKADPGLAVTINLSGKQRILTQKMSKEFLLIAYNYDKEVNKLNLQETYELFERTLKGLLDGDATLDLPGTKPKKIREQLGVVQKLWTEFKPVIETGVKSSSAISVDKIKTLANSNLSLLREMNKAVKMYEEEAGK